MKVIVAGSRDITDTGLVHQAITESGFAFTELVSGGAGGVDYCGESLAALHGMPVKVFPADWRVYGRRAGMMRNRQMAHYADALVAVWDGESPGTYGMIEEMRRLGKPVYVKRISSDQEENMLPGQ
jgi:YspA, cpYpsA-related SLOG family